MESDLTGRTLGGYRVLRKLGQGGMAVVYKAHEESLNRVVALKVIAQHLADNEQFIARFRREAQAAAQLSHPNIVQIYAIGEDGGVHFFAMEYVKGKSLAEIIGDEGFLTAGRAVPIIMQAAEALAVAHDAGIVHRDIKPANIMVDGSGRVKVADFGIAQMTTETRMTQSGMLVGTPEFISPEQCHGEKLDGRSDIYSLGVTFYQLLSGRTPFEADTPASLVLQIVSGPIPPLGELNPTVPPQVQALVGKMMHIDRNQRFQSAEDLIHALEAVDTRPAASLAAAAPGGVAAAGLAATVPATDAAVPTVIPSPPSPPSGGVPAQTVEASPPVADEAPGETIEAPPSAAAAVPAQTIEAPPATAAEVPTKAIEAPPPPPGAPTEAIETPRPPSAGAPAKTSGADPKPPAAGSPTPQAESPKTAATPPAAAPQARGGNRGAFLGLAAMVLIVVTVAIIAWQFMDDSHAAEGFDPATDARPQALREPPGEGAATETAETAEGGNESVGADPAADVTANTADVTARAADVAASTAAPAEAGSGSEPDPDAIAAAAAGGAGAPRTTDPSTPQTAARQAGAQPPTTPAADPGVQATPDPMQSAAVEQEPGPPPPAVNSIVAETTGEYEYVDQVHAWIESAFGGQSFDIVDFASSPYGTLQQAARFHVVTTAKLVGTQQLEYFGNTQTQFTVALVSRVIDLSTGTTVIGPETETIRYTSVNMQQNLERGTRQLARRMAQRLRQAIREIP